MIRYNILRFNIIKLSDKLEQNIMLFNKLLFIDETKFYSKKYFSTKYNLQRSRGTFRENP